HSDPGERFQSADAVQYALEEISIERGFALSQRRLAYLVEDVVELRSDEAATDDDPTLSRDVDAVTASRERAVRVAIAGPEEVTAGPVLKREPSPEPTPLPALTARGSIPGGSASHDLVTQARAALERSESSGQRLRSGNMGKTRIRITRRVDLNADSGDDSQR
ncbi:MAG: hypothetical protein AAGC55_17895, partial [Myxococcota bacterium]